MKKIYRLIAILAIGVGLAGCADQNKRALEKNLATNFGDKNNYELTISKYKETGAKATDTQNLAGTKMDIQVDRKSKLLQIATKMKIDGKEMNVDMIGNDSKMLMSTRSIADEMKDELKNYKDIKIPGLTKLNSMYINLNDFDTNFHMSNMSSLFGGTNSNFSKGSKEFLKDKKVTKTKDGYLKVTLNKTDSEKMLANSNKSSHKKMKKEIKNLSKLKIVLLSKGSKLIYKIKAEDKSDVKYDLVMNIKAKNKKINLKMPADKQVITTNEMQKYLTPKLK